MRGTVVSISEIARAQTLSADDFMSQIATRYGCHLCGLTPANVEDRKRPNPRTELLEPWGIDKSDPLQRSIYRCRNREACRRRQKLMVGR